MVLCITEDPAQILLKFVFDEEKRHFDFIIYLGHKQILHSDFKISLKKSIHFLWFLIVIVAKNGICGRIEFKEYGLRMVLDTGE